MKLLMRVVVPFTTVMSIAMGAQAQMWGAGLYGGMQGCPYNYQAAPASSSYSDEVQEAQETIEEAQRQLRAKKSEKKRVDRENARYRKDVENTISSDFSEFLFEHIENQVSCQEYKGLGNSEEPIVSGEEGEQPIQAGGTRDVRAFTLTEWRSLCGDRGGVSKSVCSGARFRDTDSGRRGNGASCGKAITEYRKGYKKSSDLQGEIESLEDMIKSAKEDKRLAQQNAAEERRERQREIQEGGVCIDCLVQGNSYQYQKPQTDWASVIGNIGLGLTSVYMGYKTNKMISNANANIGWPTDPYAAQGYGYGFGAMATGLGQALGGGSGIYGAIGGGIGSGAMGCAGMNGGPYGMMGPYGGMNGAGMWGNPYGMAGLGGYPGMGGGMYMPGMGPWGMAGPWGMGGPYPGMYPGSMMGGYMGGMMGYPMGSMMGGGMMGYPMGSMMGGGMMGYPMGSMMGGMIGGMMGSPMMGGGMMGYPMMGGMMGGMGMQQQMMQMQMQQYQMYMQQQQSYMQQQMQKQQVMSSLQQELYGLMYRIQQVQYGYGTGYLGGSIGSGTGIGIGTGVGIGTGITPLPGSMGTGTGVLPTGSVNGVAPIPQPR